jgi:hypothetical protein
MRKLHSGQPGVYDPLDRWKILKDVAPWSQAFRYYDKLVRSWSITSRSVMDYKSGIGPLTLQGIVQGVADGDTITVNINGRLAAVRIRGGDAPETHTFGSRSIDPSRRAEGQHAASRLSAAVMGRQVTLRNIEIDPHGRLAADVQARGLLGTSDISRQLSEAYPSNNLTLGQQAEVIQSRQATERRYQPYPFTERIFADPFTTVPRNMRQLTTKSLTSINQAAKTQGEYTLSEKIAGNIWERLTHIQLPGPLNWPVNKLFAHRDPLEYYRQIQLGSEFADWSTPLQSFARPWVQQVLGTISPTYVPSQFKAQRSALEALDLAQYTKSQRLEREAFASGDTNLADYYHTQQAQTMAGVIVTGNRRYVRGAIPRADRRFYSSFAQERDPGRRQQILNTVPSMMGTILRQQWGDPATGDRMAVHAAVESIKTQTPSDWMGYHPDVPIHLMRDRIARTHAWDYHDLGLTSKDHYLATEYFGGYESTIDPPIDVFSDAQAQLHRTLGRLHTSGSSVDIIPGNGSGFMDIRRSRDQKNFRKMYRKHDAPEQTGMRF